MQWRQLVTVLAKSEGKKSQVTVGNLREIMARLVDIQKLCDNYEEDGPAQLILARAKKKKK